MTPAAKRNAVLHARNEHHLSQRRACRIVDLQPAIYRYCQKRVESPAVRERLVQLAQCYPAWGYRPLGVRLRVEGFEVNRKRVLRLYREEGLKLRPKKRRKIVSVQRVQPPMTTGINQKWSMDFVSDKLSCGRRFRAFAFEP